MERRWVPLSARGKSEEQFDALLEGVPAHLRSSLWDWLDDRFHYLAPPRTRKFKTSLLKQFERQARHPLAWDTDWRTWEHLKTQCHSSDELFLDLVDFTLTHAIDEHHEATSLEQVLQEAGSFWTIIETGTRESATARMLGGEDHPVFALVRRVIEPIADLAQKQMSEGGRAGAHLAKAWHLIYGRDPSPNDSFLESVKAVESAMVPIVSPNNTKATLGTMLGEMKTGVDKYAIEMSTTDTAIIPFEVVRSMCQFLWKAQPSRHGTPEEREDSNVSQKSAEGAVHLAATLVQWFTTGVVRRK